MDPVQARLSISPRGTYFDADDTALVHNLLDHPSVLADHLANQITRHLDVLLAVLQHRARLPDCLFGLTGLNNFINKRK